MKPFNLNAALNKEPFTQIKSINSDQPLKCYIIGKSLINTSDQYYIIQREDSTLTEVSLFTLETYYKMYEEPRPTINVTLPCPLKEPQPDMWFITSSFTVTQSTYSSDTTKEKTVSEEMLKQGLYFATREDAQAWLNTLKNSRR